MNHTERWGSSLCTTSGYDGDDELCQPPDPGPQERFWRSPHCSTSCGPIFFGTGHRCLDCKSSFLCSRQLFKWKAISSKAEKCKYEYEMSVDVIFWIHGFKLVFFAPRGLAVRGSGFTGACPWMELSVDQWKMIVFNPSSEYSGLKSFRSDW